LTKNIVELMKASAMVTGISFAFPMAAMLTDIRKSLIALCLL
jgi:hypothetical protein